MAPQYIPRKRSMCDDAEQMHFPRNPFQLTLRYIALSGNWKCARTRTCIKKSYIHTCIR